MDVLALRQVRAIIFLVPRAGREDSHDSQQREGLLLSAMSKAMSTNIIEIKIISKKKRKGKEETKDNPEKSLRLELLSSNFDFRGILSSNHRRDTSFLHKLPGATPYAILASHSPMFSTTESAQHTRIDPARHSRTTGHRDLYLVMRNH